MLTDTSYLGFRLPYPFIAGASPFGHHLDTVRRLEDAGCAAVVLHSLFEEQITGSRQGRLRYATREVAPSHAAFSQVEEYPLGPDAYAEHVRRVKQAVAMPVIGSLNGTSPESWLAFALVAFAILLLTGLIHWGVEYQTPPWNAHSYPPPVVHQW